MQIAPRHNARLRTAAMHGCMPPKPGFLCVFLTVRPGAVVPREQAFFHLIPGGTGGLVSAIQSWEMRSRSTSIRDDVPVSKCRNS